MLCPLTFRHTRDYGATLVAVVVMRMIYNSKFIKGEEKALIKSPVEQVGIGQVSTDS